MDQFKVNVSKEALEKHYGRELSGQEVETAERILERKFGLPELALDADCYFRMKNNGKMNTSGLYDRFDNWSEPERPLSDFLPAQKAIETNPGVIPVLDVCCLLCRFNTGDSPECPLMHMDEYPKVSESIFYCASFESRDTGLGVEGTIRTDILKTTQDVIDKATVRGPLGLTFSTSKTTPNCALCRWLSKDNTMSGNPKCTACGYLHPSEAHNTPECRALYDPKIETIDTACDDDH